MKMSIQQRNYDYLYKLILIGDSDSGKTHLVRLFSNQKNPACSTIGIDFEIRIVDVDGTKVKVQIWDTAGQERFRTITTAYYRGAHGVFLVYNTANAKSFEHMQLWLNDVKLQCGEDVVIMVVAHYVDANVDPVVSTEDGKKFAALNDLMFVECCWKDENLEEEAFFKMLRKVHEINRSKSAYQLLDTNGKSINLSNSNDKKSSCC